MPKIVIKDIDQFAKDYPHLVRTKIEPDIRKIKTSLANGWEVKGVEVVEGEDAEDDDTAPGKPQEEQTGASTSSGTAQAPQAPLVPKEEQAAIRELMVPQASPSIVQEKYDEKDRLPGEETREFYTRMRVKKQAEDLEKKAQEKAAQAVRKTV